MTGRTSDWTLRGRVTALVLIVIGALVVAETAFSLALYRSALVERIGLKAAAASRAAASDALLGVAVWAKNGALLGERLDAALATDAELAFAAVVDEAGEPQGVSTRTYVDRAVVASLLQSAASDEFEIARAALVDPGGGAATGADDDLGLLDAPGQKQEAAKKSFVVVGVDRGTLAASLAKHAAASLVMGVLALIAAWIVVRQVFSSVFRRVEGMRIAVARLAEGDLTRPVADGSVDEIGSIGAAVDRVRGRWTGVVREISAVAGGVVEASARILRDAEEVAAGSVSQLKAADGAQARTDDIVKQSARVAARVADVASASQESRRALEEASEAARSVSSRMAGVKKDLAENGAHRANLSATVGRISQALDELKGAVESAQRDVADVAARTAEVDATAKEIADKAQDAVARSGEGLALLVRQKEASDAVATTTAATATAASALEASMNDVLASAGLIGEIADLTSMLSLNASIIAAQAGDKALGFATISEEIRSLASRTRQASQGIESRTADAKRQIDVVGDSVRALGASVQAARQASTDAASALEDVLDAMKGTLTDVGGIAKLAGTSATRTASSRASVDRISAELARIADAVQRHKGASARLDESFAAIAEKADLVAHTGSQQATSTAALLARVSSIFVAAEDLVTASAAQTRHADAIAKDVSSVRDTARRHATAVSAISTSVSELNEQSGALQGAIASLRVAAVTDTGEER